MQNRKTAAQVSIETLIVLGIIVSIFVVALVSIAFKNYQAAYFKELFENQNSCNKLALAVSISFSEGKKNFLLFELDKNVSIAEHSITVGSYYCNFIGNAVPKNLEIGEIKIKNETGVVEFEQA